MGLLLPLQQSLLASQRSATTNEHGWMYVTQRFTQLLRNIRLTENQLIDGKTKTASVVKCLNAHYWGNSISMNNYLLVGSWGKETYIRPPRDIDILFGLPSSTYKRYRSRAGNIQSQLLQEVKIVIANTNSTTEIRGDGQVVVVPFSSIKVEVVPAFQLTDGKFLICDTNGGGRYKTIDPIAEMESFNYANELSKYKVCHLVRILKCWQSECNVPLKSFLFERLAVEFMRAWVHKDEGYFWYDWMIRDFFAYLLARKNSYLYIPSNNGSMMLGDTWESKAKKAYNEARQACEYEEINNDVSANYHWRKIFGADIPWIT